MVAFLLDFWPNSSLEAIVIAQNKRVIACEEEPQGPVLIPAIVTDVPNSNGANANATPEEEK